MRKILNVLLKIVIFAVVWFISLTIILAIFVPKSGEITSLFTLLFILMGPIALAVLAVLPWNKILSNHHSNTRPIQTPVNISASTQPDVTLPVVPVFQADTSTSQSNFPPSVDNIAVEVAESVKAIQEESNSKSSVPSAQSNSPNFTTASGKAGKVYRVTGVQHYVDNLLQLGCENSDYNMTKRQIIDNFMTDERIYKYSFYGSKVTLLPEPTNPYDPNAIKVIIDGQHVGYIKKGSCKHLLKMIAENRIHGIDCDIGGGPYKYVYESEDEYGKYELDKGDLNYSVTLHIQELEK